MGIAVGLLVLAGTGIALLAGLLGTARRPAAALPDRAGYLTRWSELHGGADPRATPFVAPWLGLVHRLAVPLARRGLSPDGLTLLGLWASAAVLPAAFAGGGWPLLGAAAVVASGVLDTLDGAVAALSGRATPFGHVLDSVVDRAADGLWLLALWALGAPGGLGVGAGAAVMLLEYTRARAAGAGRGTVGLITPGERPTRLILTAVGLLAAAALPAHAVLAATVATAAVLAVCGGSFLLLLADVRRTLSG